MMYLWTLIGRQTAAGITHVRDDIVNVSPCSECCSPHAVYMSVKLGCRHVNLETIMSLMDFRGRR